MRRTARDSEDRARSITRRGLFMGGSMAAFLAVLGARMRYMQVDLADEFRLLSEENRVNIRLIPPARGLILDRKGRVIAGNEQNYRVVITREDAGDVPAVLTRLSHVIPLFPVEMAKVEAEADASSPFVPIIVKDRMPWEDFARVALNAPSLPGVQPEVGLSRVYPLLGDFSHVVGYVGPVSENDLEGTENPDPILTIPKFQIGKIGVERWQEDVLRGAAGTRRIEVNAGGRVMRELERVDGVPGADLMLTIDADVQNFAQARLGAESAAAVVMDVNTGDLLAIASSPSFDPNMFVRGISQRDYSTLLDSDHRPLANKAVQGVYPPGSTFKMVTALAALEAGVATPETTHDCAGYIEYGDRRFNCWKSGGHGSVAMERALAESCDVYFYAIAQKVGIDLIAAMGKQLGLGIRHDLPMSAIAEGTMPDKAWKQASYQQQWRVGDTINASIGQGFVLTSPLQLAVMTARLATGRAVLPRLVRAIDGVLQTVPDYAALPIDPVWLGVVQNGMREVTMGARGTAKSSRIVDDAMIMAGKTGTSQVRNISAAERAQGVVANENLPWERRDHALFVGYAPSDAPKYAVSVVVEHGGGGSLAAAPMARDIILRAMSDGLPPLEAYPKDQRGRMESLLNALPLRDLGAAPTRSGA